MSDKISYESFLREANEYHVKYEFYFLGIIIALLTLSIQTFHADDSTKFIFFIFIMWFLLVISLLTGFYRLEKILLSKYYEVDKLYEIQYQNSNMNSKKLTEIHENIIKINKSLAAFYKLQKWTFILAIFTFLVFKILNVYC